MSEIKVGDLVWVFRPTPCCNSHVVYGKHFTVTRIQPGNAHCVMCGAEHGVLALAFDDSGAAYRLSGLKRIPPLADLESSTTEALDPADCLAAYETQPKEMTK